MATPSYELIFCIFLFILLRRVHCQHGIGDFCTIQNTGESGQCQLLQTCTPAIEALQLSSIYPQNCGFKGKQPIVCCAETATSTRTTQATISTSSTAPIPVTNYTPSNASTQTSTGPLRVGEKSKQKCREYGKYIYVDSVAGQDPLGDCGLTSVPLLMAELTAGPKEFPHMALIGFDDINNKTSWQCSGSLISERFVLTAAHCLYYMELGEPKYVRIGDRDLNTDTDDADPQEFNITERIRHPSYTPPSQYNDIALLKLDRIVRLNPYVRPACLEISSDLNPIKKPLVSGWNQVSFMPDSNHKTLTKLTLGYFTNAECNQAYKNIPGGRLRNGIVNQTQICAGVPSKDICQGDSGGPLQIINKEVYCTYKIVGITSFGKPCGSSLPGLYTRVSNYIEWIEGIVWP